MILGFDGAGEGPVLLLVHAFPGDRRHWSDQVAALSDIRRVIAVDLPGRGFSSQTESAPETWSMDSYADDVAETIEALGGGPVDLGGISMGGYVLFSFWRRHPRSVRSLVLVSTRSTEDPPEGKQGRKNVAALVREKGTPELIGMMSPKLFGPGVGDQARRRLHTMIQELPAETAAADSLAMGRRPDSTADLGAINVPTLVLHGEHDALLPPENAKEMAARIPGAGFRFIPGSGHLAPLENPEAVTTVIRRFLESQGAGGV